MDPPTNNGGAPNAVRILLAIASAISFIPQINRILTRQDCAGLSGSYLLYNLLTATSHFSLSLYAIIDHESAGIFTHSPPTTGDILNLVQFITVMAGHLIIFGAYLYYPSPDVSFRHKFFLTLWFMLFLTISVVPVIWIATLPPPDSGRDYVDDRRWPAAMWSGLTIGFVIPLVTILTLFSYIPQSRALRSRRDEGVGALSTLGLAIQSLVFLIGGLVWHSRWVYNLTYLFVRNPFVWYSWGGFALLNYVFFASVQGSLWWIARDIERRVLFNGESSPLLG